MAVGARTVGMARRVSAVAGDGARLHLVLPERRERLSDRSSLRQSPAAAPSPGCPPRVGPAAHFGRFITMPIAFVKAPTVKGFWSTRPSFGASAGPASGRYPET